jgi:hypothetical protein
MVICPKQNMMRSYSINIIVLLLFCTSMSSQAMTVVTTDFAVMRDIQNFAEETSMKKGQAIDVIAVDSQSLIRYLQIGEKGDVLITSSQKLCGELSAKGLASYFIISQIIQEKIYCVNGDFIKKVLIFTQDDHMPETEDMLYSFASQLGANTRIIGRNENLHQVVMEYVNGGVALCGLQSLFINLDVHPVLLQDTNLSIEYYACPLVGLYSDAYRTIMEYYETKHSSKN